MTEIAPRRLLIVGGAALVAGAAVLVILALAGSPAALPPWSWVVAAALLAAAAAVAGERLGQPRGVPTVSSAPPHGALGAPSAHGLLPTLDAMLRFEEELSLAHEYGRPLCIALAGIDVTPGLDIDDAMEGLRQLTDGAVRRQDLITDRDRTSILVMAPETSAAMGWVMAERVLKRAGAAGVGTVRLVLVSAQGRDSLRMLLGELDSGLELCRSTGQLFADPSRLLAARA